MSLNKNTVIKIANLSKIDIKDSEIEELTSDLNKIVSWIEQLNEVDIENVLPQVVLKPQLWYQCILLPLNAVQAYEEIYNQNPLLI